MERELSHFNKDGSARMVDVTGKPVTERRAVAEGFVRLKPETMELIINREISKGDVLGVARVAGIMAAKQTPSLIPMCHPLNISSVTIDFETGESYIKITADVRLAGQTGVEMEALTAVSVAALTIYDMCKAVDKGMEIGGITLTEKSGGKSGHFKK